MYTSSLDVGDTTTATVGGLQEGLNYFFSVSAYDAVGLSSAPSDEIWYQVPMRPGTDPSVQLAAGSQPGVAAHIGFSASPNRIYELQATDDFQSWTTIWYSSPAPTIRWLEFSDSDTTASGTRFYRLEVHRVR